MKTADSKQTEIKMRQGIDILMEKQLFHRFCIVYLDFYKCSVTADTNDWNDRGKAEEWRRLWANYVNRSLTGQGIYEKVDNRFYKCQGIEKIPSVHTGRTHRWSAGRHLQIY